MFHIYKWHSINLIPHASYCSTFDDKLKIGRLLQITFLGIVLNICWKASKSRRAYFGKALGPFYSRQRKCWYWDLNFRSVFDKKEVIKK